MTITPATIAELRDKASKWELQAALKAQKEGE